MRYPDNYKVQTMFISKFERDFNSQIDYQFINAFPKLVTAIPVSYGAADLLKVSVQFTYDRYIVNPKGSIKKANISEFNDIARVANDSNVKDLQAFIEDNRVEGGYNDEQLSILGNGGFIERLIEPTASTTNPAKKVLKRPPAAATVTTTTSQQQETPMEYKERNKISLEALKALEDK